MLLYMLFYLFCGFFMMLGVFLLFLLFYGVCGFVNVEMLLIYSIFYIVYMYDIIFC